jgi:Mce-associated membrane protein
VSDAESTAEQGVEVVDTEVTDVPDADDPVSGETVSDETVSDETVPDETVPDETVSDETVSPRPRKRSLKALVAAAVLSVALLASAGLAGWLYFYQYRPDQQTDSAASRVALDAATNGTIALLSYSPESLDKDFATAKAKLTGDFLSYYTQFTEQIVTPAAKEKSVKTAASVVRAAVSNIEPDKAQVLVFINQTTTSKENPDGSFAASCVKVGLKKIDGAWLIESFDPV